MYVLTWALWNLEHNCYIFLLCCFVRGMIEILEHERVPMCLLVKIIPFHLYLVCLK
jgi:hypothetical protein